SDGSQAVTDLLDPALWEQSGWGLADPRRAGDLATLMPDVRDAGERRAAALAFQRRALERARAFHAALDRRDATPPDGLELRLVAGDATDTAQQVAVNRTGGGALRVVAWGPGDGTVLRSSALLDERAGAAWRPSIDSPLSVRQTLLLPDTHLGLTHSTVFRDNVLYWLLEEPRRKP
ncbi:MAG TPA: hypothetical protein VFT98_03950, partial [Myxococcota bacterium]|nr:hypothetical protein [Myxococcota bacterium]